MQGSCSINGAWMNFWKNKHFASCSVQNCINFEQYASTREKCVSCNFLHLYSFSTTRVVVFNYQKKVHFLYTMTLWHKLWNRSYTTFSEIYGLHEKPAFTSVSRTHRTYFQSEYSVRFHSAWSFHKFTTLGTKSQKAECKDNGKSTQNNRQT